MLSHLFVILDRAATSFCYYRNPTVQPQLMALQLLKEVVFFAQKENLIINFLAGKEPLPADYLAVIDDIDHIIISSSDRVLTTNEDILVINYNRNGSKCPTNKDANIILRIEKKDLPQLVTIIQGINAYKRLNVVLLDIEQYTEPDFDEYKKQLAAIEPFFVTTFTDKPDTELNILSDRLMLDRMNNCEAGVTHLTFAPNGKFYLCPAFYYEDEAGSIGDLSGIELKNKHLYQLDKAPICRKCDAFQCKRCLFLNRKLTLEVNTPSHEQCVLSHLERNASKQFLEKVRSLLPGFLDKEMCEIDYLDPFDTINNPSIIHSAK